MDRAIMVKSKIKIKKPKTLAWPFPPSSPCSTKTGSHAVYSQNTSFHMTIKIAPYLYIADTPLKGRGVFTKKDIPPMKTIEISSVLVMSAKEKEVLDQTALHDYIFAWGNEEEQCCVAWGYISLYNHSYQANCEYFMDFEKQLITIKTIREVKDGEELTINYNGDWNNTKPIWFKTI